MAQRVVLIMVAIWMAPHAAFATRLGNGLPMRSHTRMLLQELAEEAAEATAAVEESELAQPLKGQHALQQEVLPAAASLVVTTGGVTDFPAGCSTNASYLPVRLFCQYNALLTACTNIPDALLREDVKAINDNIAATSGSTRQRLCYLGMVDSAGLLALLSAPPPNLGLLVAYSWTVNSLRGATVFTAAEQAAVEAAMNAKQLKKLMIWHSMNDPAVPSGVPLLNRNCSRWNDTVRQYIHTEAAALSGAYPAIPAYVGATAGSSAAWGSCSNVTVQKLGSTAKTYAEASLTATAAGILMNEVTAFSYCRPGGGQVFFSTVPADFDYTKARVTGWLNLRKFHATALSAFTSDKTVCA